MSLLLGIDIGTSATKAILIDERGQVRATADSPHELSMPHPGWSEQHPDWWWNAASKAIRAATASARCDGPDIRAVGFSGQMHGSVFLPANADPHDPKPVRPALLWNDQRTAAQCAEIEAAAGGREPLIAMTGNPALTGFTAPKILWLREHEPANFERTRTILLPKDYVRFRMTGEPAIDAGDASGTLLLDPRTRDWHRDLMSKLGLDSRIFPKVVESPEVAGNVSAWAAEQTGLAAGTPVVAGSGDQMTGAVGMGIVTPGLVSATLGTSGVVLAHAGKTLPQDPSGRVQVMCAAIPGEWCVYGCMLSAAGALQWFRDAFAEDVPFPTLDEEASRVSPGADGLLFLPHLTGERCPHPDPLARGAFIGLTARHRRAHLVRAVLEGVAMTMAEILDLIRSLGIDSTEIRMGGGGAKSELWRSIHAAAFGAPVTTLNTAEGSAYGAALLAGVGARVWSTVPQACEACLREESRVDPAQRDLNGLGPVRSAFALAYPQARGLMHLLSGSPSA